MIPHLYLKVWTVDLLFYATAFIDPGVGYSNQVYQVKRIKQHELFVHFKVKLHNFTLD